MTNFADKLAAAVRQKQTPVVVGLDPRFESLPESIRRACRDSQPAAVAAAVSEFCRSVIDVVAPLVPAVKPQVAFFEQLGPPGLAALAEVIAHARQRNCSSSSTPSETTSVRPPKPTPRLTSVLLLPGRPMR